MAGRKAEFHPDAVAEAAAAYVWYASRSPSAAGAFSAELTRGVKEAAANPHRWAPFLRGARRILLRRFPYAIVYQVTAKTIQVIAVAHIRRKPGYWKSRPN